MSNRRNTREYKTALDNALKRDSHMCVKCGRGINLQVHHIVPYAFGGTENLENLITLCVFCHNEWENLAQLVNYRDEQSVFSFSEWLSFPPYGVLLGMWRDELNIINKSLREIVNVWQELILERFDKIGIANREDFLALMKNIAGDT